MTALSIVCLLAGLACIPVLDPVTCERLHSWWVGRESANRSILLFADDVSALLGVPEGDVASTLADHGVSPSRGNLGTLAWDSEQVMEVKLKRVAEAYGKMSEKMGLLSIRM